MEGEDLGMGSPEKEDYEGSSHSTPQEHRSFAEFAKDKLDSGKLLRDSCMLSMNHNIMVYLLIEKP